MKDLFRKPLLWLYLTLIGEPRSSMGGLCPQLLYKRMSRRSAQFVGNYFDQLFGYQPRLMALARIETLSRITPRNR